MTQGETGRAVCRYVAGIERPESQGESVALAGGASIAQSEIRPSSPKLVLPDQRQRQVGTALRHFRSTGQRLHRRIPLPSVTDSPIDTRDGVASGVRLSLCVSQSSMSHYWYSTRVGKTLFSRPAGCFTSIFGFRSIRIWPLTRHTPSCSRTELVHA